MQGVPGVLTQPTYVLALLSKGQYPCISFDFIVDVSCVFLVQFDYISRIERGSKLKHYCHGGVLCAFLQIIFLIFVIVPSECTAEHIN